VAANTTRARSREGAQRIRDYIAARTTDGTLAPGAKLPTERELAKRFSVPRNAVRKTLAQLEAEGSITRHVGRGTFLAGRAGGGNDDTPASSVAHTSPAELMEARLRIEPALAELIVTHATAAEPARPWNCSISSWQIVSSFGLTLSSRSSERMRSTRSSDPRTNSPRSSRSVSSQELIAGARAPP